MSWCFSNSCFRAVPRVGESMGKPFKNHFSVPFTLVGLVFVSPVGFQSYTFGWLVSFRCRDDAQCRFRLFTPEGVSCWVTLPGVCRWDCVSAFPLGNGHFLVLLMCRSIQVLIFSQRKIFHRYLYIWCVCRRRWVRKFLQVHLQHL